MPALSFKADILGSVIVGGGSEDAMVWGVPKDAITPFVARFLTQSELRSIIGIFSELQSGLVPGPPADSTGFLRADGLWVNVETNAPDAGGFTTEIDSAGIQINIGSALDGIHKRLSVAAPLRLLNNAAVGTTVAVTPASTGTSNVTLQAGAVYRLPPTDDPGDSGRTAAFNIIDYTEFECIVNDDNVSAEWDVWGVPAGLETQLSGTLDLNGQTVIPGAPVTVNTGVTRDYLASDSGKTFRVDVAATQRIPGGLGSGWTVEIWNNTGSAVTIEGPGATNPPLPSGQVAIVKYLSTTTIKVAIGETVQIS